MFENKVALRRFPLVEVRFRRVPLTNVCEHMQRATRCRLKSAGAACRSRARNQWSVATVIGRAPIRITLCRPFQSDLGCVHICRHRRYLRPHCGTWITCVANLHSGQAESTGARR